MPLEVMTGKDVPSLMAKAQSTLGDEAVVLSVRRIVHEGRPAFELVAADARTAAQQRAIERASRRGAEAVLAADRRAPAMPPELLPAPAQPVQSTVARAIAAWQSDRVQAHARAHHEAGTEPVRANTRGWRGLGGWLASRARRPRSSTRPRTIALVGPPGSGKTTTLAKLATHDDAHGGQRVGMLDLDVFRVGASEQLRQWASLARVPIETLHEEGQLRRAMSRLQSCEVLLVDTPGRSRAAATDLAQVHQRLLAVAPDEVHLVVPAGLTMPALRRTLSQYLVLGVTHLLPSRLDDHPDERAVFEVARQYGLPMRWLAVGQQVPGDLARAPGQGAAPASAWAGRS